jgi:hypothetical protein
MLQLLSSPAKIKKIPVQHARLKQVAEALKEAFPALKVPVAPEPKRH